MLKGNSLSEYEKDVILEATAKFLPTILIFSIIVLSARAYIISRQKLPLREILIIVFFAILYLWFENSRILTRIAAAKRNELKLTSTEKTMRHDHHMSDFDRKYGPNMNEHEDYKRFIENYKSDRKRMAIRQRDGSLRGDFYKIRIDKKSEQAYTILFIACMGVGGFLMTYKNDSLFLIVSGFVFGFIELLRRTQAIKLGK